MIRKIPISTIMYKDVITLHSYDSLELADYLLNRIIFVIFLLLEEKQ